MKVIEGNFKILSGINKEYKFTFSNKELYSCTEQKVIHHRIIYVDKTGIISKEDGCSYYDRSGLSWYNPSFHIFVKEIGTNKYINTNRISYTRKGKKDAYKKALELLKEEE